MHSMHYPADFLVRKYKRKYNLLLARVISGQQRNMTAKTRSSGRKSNFFEAIKFIKFTDPLAILLTTFYWILHAKLRNLRRVSAGVLVEMSKESSRAQLDAGQSSYIPERAIR